MKAPKLLSYLVAGLCTCSNIFTHGADTAGNMSLDQFTTWTQEPQNNAVLKRIINNLEMVAGQFGGLNPLDASAIPSGLVASHRTIINIFTYYHNVLVRRNTKSDQLDFSRDKDQGYASLDVFTKGNIGLLNKDADTLWIEDINSLNNALALKITLKAKVWEARSRKQAGEVMYGSTTQIAAGLAQYIADNDYIVGSASDVALWLLDGEIEEPDFGQPYVSYNTKARSSLVAAFRNIAGGFEAIEQLVKGLETRIKRDVGNNPPQGDAQLYALLLKSFGDLEATLTEYKNIFV